MKMILIILSCACVALNSYAQPEKMPPLVCDGVTTSTVSITSTSQNLSAYINAIKVVVSPSAQTCTVTVASGLETIDSRVDANGTYIVRPVAQNSTNGVVTDSFSKLFLASDAITVSASTSMNVTNLTVTVTPIVERQP